MGDCASLATHALHGLARSGRYGADAGEAGVSARLVRPLSIALVTARSGRADRCRAALASLAGCAESLVAPSRLVSGNRVDVAWTGPDRWLVLAEGWEDPEAPLLEACGENATIVDHSDGRFLLRLHGPKVRACLAKGVSIDLHPRVFRPGDSVPVWVTHLQAHLARRDDGSTYDLLGPRAAAGDLWHWLTASAGEFGLDADVPL